MSELYELSRPFPESMVQKPPKGKFGEYVPHYDVNQRALSIVGPHSFALEDLIRGHAPAVGDKFPARENAVVGVTASLNVIVDDTHVNIVEVGTADNPAMSTDAENAKNALSDAYKRCWMRVGLGLHLWARNYWLDTQLEKKEGHASVKALYDSGE